MLVGDVIYYAANGRRLAQGDVNVPAAYGRSATRETDSYYSVWTCTSDDRRHTIVTHKGIVLHDGIGDWVAPWDRHGER